MLARCQVTIRVMNLISKLTEAPYGFHGKRVSVSHEQFPGFLLDLIRSNMLGYFNLVIQIELDKSILCFNIVVEVLVVMVDLVCLDQRRLRSV